MLTVSIICEFHIKIVKEMTITFCKQELWELPGLHTPAVAGVLTHQAVTGESPAGPCQAHLSWELHCGGKSD